MSTIREAGALKIIRTGQTGNLRYQIHWHGKFHRELTIENKKESLKLADTRAINMLIADTTKDLAQATTDLQSLQKL